MATYSMRHLDVFDQHNHLLLGDEALEVVPRAGGIERHNLGGDTIPKDAASDWEEIPHEVGLRGYLHFDGTIAQATESAGDDIGSVSLDRPHRIFKRHKFDVGVHGLARHLIHDDVHTFVCVVQDLGIAAEESNHFGASRGKRNLCSKIRKELLLTSLQRAGAQLLLTFLSLIMPQFIGFANLADSIKGKLDGSMASARVGSPVAVLISWRSLLEGGACIIGA